MPSAGEILASLERIANDATAVAIVWHATAFVVLAAGLAGFRPGAVSLAWMSLLPVASVSAVSLTHESWFNGIAFLILTIALAVLTSRRGAEGVPPAPPWAVVAGAMLGAFAWTYPHFLDATHSPLAYLYAAPMGVIPCPTLSLVIAVALVTGAPAGPMASRVLALAGAFYGIFGMAKLGVAIDAVLVVGAAALAVLDLGKVSQRARAAGAQRFREDVP